MRLLSENWEHVEGKTVLLRVNYDVDIVDGKVQDTTRIEDSLDTIHALLERGCKVVLIAHLGRPDGERNMEFSLLPVHELLANLIGEPITFLENLDAEAARNAPTRVVMLENLRFWSEEEANDEEFARRLAAMGDFYVNEAFANCHREHASIVGIPKFLPYAAGLHLAREYEILTRARQNPEKPLVVIIGGAKVETKAPLVDAFADIADEILVGGKIASEISEEHKSMPNLAVADLREDGKDITEESARLFADKIMNAKSVIWNGTMGIFEEEDSQMGTTIVAEAMNTTDAFTVVGGGDTEAALTVLDMEAGIDHISTGGGAMLDYLCDGNLVGFDALN